MIGSCPECKESIRVPEGTADAIVRCPLCNAEYELETVLDSLPPMLELVSAGGAGIDIAVASGEDSALDVSKSDSTPRPAPSRRYRPQKRKQVNMFAEIIKVILGGVVAIPIGVLCVWWFAGRAPFGVAEHVSKFAPWIVPEGLRGGDQINDEDLNGGGQSNKKIGKKSKSPQNKADKNREVVPRGGGGLMGGQGSLFFDQDPEKDTQKSTNKNNQPDKSRIDNDLNEKQGSLNNKQNKAVDQPVKKLESDQPKKEKSEPSNNGEPKQSNRPKDKTPTANNTDSNKLGTGEAGDNEPDASNADGRKQ